MLAAKNTDALRRWLALAAQFSYLVSTGFPHAGSPAERRETANQRLQCKGELTGAAHRNSIGTPGLTEVAARQEGTSGHAVLVDPVPVAALGLPGSRSQRDGRDDSRVDVDSGWRPAARKE